MKRRGFLGMLLGAPAMPVAAAVLSKLPRGLVESEPEIIHVKTEILGAYGWKPVEDYADEAVCSAFVMSYPLKGEIFRKG